MLIKFRLINCTLINQAITQPANNSAFKKKTNVESSWYNSKTNVLPCLFFHEMYNKTIIEFGFCDMRNYQGRGKCYQPS